MRGVVVRRRSSEEPNMKYLPSNRSLPRAGGESKYVVDKNFVDQRQCPRSLFTIVFVEENTEDQIVLCFCKFV